MGVGTAQEGGIGGGVNMEVIVGISYRPLSALCNSLYQCRLLLFSVP